MRDFKNPTYDGPDCVCCKSKATAKEELVTIELTDLTEAQLEMVNVVIHEGELRERERIFALLEAEKARTKLGFIQYRRIEELVQPEVRSDAD